jgi:hypothetical protein
MKGTAVKPSLVEKKKRSIWRRIDVRPNAAFPHPDALVARFPWLVKKKPSFTALK